MLCSTCQGIFEGQLLVRKAVSMSGDVTYLRDHHHETCALQRSAEQGCLVCARLWQLLERRGETTSPTLNLDMCGISLTEITSGSLNSLLFRYRLRNGELLYEHFMIWPKSSTSFSPLDLHGMRNYPLSGAQESIQRYCK